MRERDVAASAPLSSTAPLSTRAGKTVKFFAAGVVNLLVKYSSGLGTPDSISLSVGISLFLARSLARSMALSCGGPLASLACSSRLGNVGSA